MSRVFSLFKKTAILAALVFFTVMAATPANNAEQVVFSTPGFCCMALNGNSTASSTPFGFWIWCNPQAATGSNSAYETACQGNMYFYALNVNAEPVLGSIVETSPGEYTMNVVQGTFSQFLHGTLNPDFVCTLSNPSAAPTHTVTVSCSGFSAKFGGGSSSSPTNVTNTTVSITGS